MSKTKVNPSKGSPTPIERSIDKRQERHNQIRGICSYLSGESSSFDPKITYEQIEKYIHEHKRWFYSDISNFLFAFNSESDGTFMSNLDSLLAYSYEKAERRGKDDLANQQVIMIEKLWDHANLALHQKNAFSTKESDIDARIAVKLTPKVDDLEKGLRRELISLIAIFTALSFVVFGGISSLDNIFEGARSFPIIQVLIIGCVWGLCILNLVFVFVFFVSKLTRLPIASTDREDANVVQKYPFWIYSNFLIVFLLAIFGWLYFVDYANSGTWLIYYMQSNPKSSLIGGLVVIIAIFALLFLGITRQFKKNTVNPT